MEKSRQEKAPDGMTENKPFAGPIVFIPLIVILAFAIGVFVWIALRS